MKKIFAFLIVFFVLLGVVTAKEKETLQENLRLEFVLGDSISTNILSLNNTTNAAVELTTYNNNIGFIAGAMYRESTDPDFNLHSFNWNPYLGIELWNNEILVGAVFYPYIGSTDGENNVDINVGPYVAYNYTLDLIKPKTGVSNSLSLKFGVEYFFDVLSKDNATGEDGVETALLLAFSTFIPKASIGIQYKVGYGWAY